MFSVKPKLNSKIRFQKSGFRHKLSDARAYRRPAARKLNGSEAGSLFRKLAKKRHLFLAALVLIFAAGIYAVFVPNFLRIKTVDINGVNLGQRAEVKSAVAAYFKAQKMRLGQNYLFISTANLASYIKDNDKNIFEVSEIKKSFPDTLIIYVKPRAAAFVARLPAGKFLVSNDGLVQSILMGTGTPLKYAGFPVISSDSTASPVTGQEIFKPNTLSAVEYLWQKIPDSLRAQVSEFQVSDSDAFGIAAVINGNVKLMLNPNDNLDEILARAGVLLNSMSDSDKAKLFYVDLRFGERGYTCFRDAPCTQATNFAQFSTSTPDVLGVSTSTASTTIIKNR